MILNEKNKIMKMKILKSLISIVLLLFTFYIAFFIFLIRDQDKIIYHPPARDFDTCKSFPSGTQNVTHNQTRMHHRHNDQSDTVVIFYHGNGNIACDLGFLANSFEVNNVSYIFPEYEGYGGDGEIATSDGVKRTVQNVISYIETQKYQNVIIIGQSVGTGAATYHTQIKSPDKLLLISPFDSIMGIAMNRFALYPKFLIQRFVDNAFDSIENLAKYKKEFVILHGNKDLVIPITRGKNLFENLNNDNKKLIIIPDVGHNRMYQDDEVMQVIKKFIQD